MNKYKQEIEEYNKKIEKLLEKEENWEKVRGLYVELEKECNNLVAALDSSRCYCLADTYHVFPKLEKAKQFWIELKIKQELEKFKAGDFTAQIGDDYGRTYGIRIDICVLCKQSSWCLFFADNENYGEESICESCMQVALTKIKLERRE